MGTLFDDFEDLIESEDDIKEKSEQLSLELIENYKGFMKDTKRTYSGVDINHVRESLEVAITESIPWEHVCMTLDVSKLRDVSKPRLTYFNIPSFVEEIRSIGDTNNSGFGYNEFGRNHLKTIVIPKNISVIDDNTFAFYRKLESVIFEKENMLNKLGSYAFAYCENLKEIDLSECKRLEALPDNLCMNSSIKKIKISSNIRYISLSAFNNSEVDTIFIDDIRYGISEFISSLNGSTKVFW